MAEIKTWIDPESGDKICEVRRSVVRKWVYHPSPDFWPEAIETSDAIEFLKLWGAQPRQPDEWIRD